MRRFETIPDILHLDHLTVSGNVNFGKNVILKGTVIIIANYGDQIDIPDGSVLENKIVSGNSLNDINQLVFSKSVDIAFTNKSALVLQNDVKYYEIPTSLYNPIPQGMVLIKTEDKTKSTEANTFYNFIKSSEGKQILVNSGYIVK